MDHWKQQHRDKEVFLSWEKVGDALLVRDTRFGECREIRLDAPQAGVYLAVDRHPKTLESLAREIDLTDREIEAEVEALDRARLVWREDDSVLGLAAPSSVVDGHRQCGWPRQWTSLYS